MQLIFRRDLYPLRAPTRKESSIRNRGRSPVGVLFLILFLDLVGFSIIFPLFPAMLEYYAQNEVAGSLFTRLVESLTTLAGAEESTDWRVMTLFGGALGSLYSFLQFLFSPFWGSLSDRIGRRPVLLLTIAGLALSYLLWFVSGSFLLLVVSRLVGGMMSGNISTATAAMADSTGPEERSKGMGIIGAAFGLGFILGPAIGGGLSYFDLSAAAPAGGSWGLHPFSAAALGAFLLSVGNLIWVARRFPETLPPEKRGTSEGRSINPVRLLGSGTPPIRRTNFAYLVFLVAFSGMEFTLTFLVTDRLGWTRGQITWMFVYVGLVIALIQGGVVRRVAPRFGEKRLAMFGLVVVVPGLWIISFATSSGLFYVGLTLMGVGSALSIPTMTALVSLLAPADRQGSILGVFRSVGALARVIGPISAAVIYWKFGEGTPYLWGALAMVIPILLLVTVPQPSKEPEPVAVAE